VRIRRGILIVTVNCLYKQASLREISRALPNPVMTVCIAVMQSLVHAVVEILILCAVSIQYAKALDRF